VLIHRDKAADLSVNVASIATAMRTLVGGDDQVTTYREGDDRHDVQLRVNEEFRRSPQRSNGSTRRLTLGNASLERRQPDGVHRTAQIARYNRQRQVMILATLRRDKRCRTCWQF
jgi:HAE1 family hydrophobic/amphiphilic exporter-1